MRYDVTDIPWYFALAVLALAVVGVVSAWIGNTFLDIRARRAIPKLWRGERVPYRVERRAKEIDGTPEMCVEHTWHGTGRDHTVRLAARSVLMRPRFHCSVCRRVGYEMGGYIIPVYSEHSWDNDCAGCAPEKYKVAAPIIRPVEDPMSFSRWLFR